MFVSEGCDVNITNLMGCTPLMLAASMNNVTLACLLISHGANVNQVSLNVESKCNILLRLYAQIDSNCK